MTLLMKPHLQLMPLEEYFPGIKYQDLCSVSGVLVELTLPTP